MSELTFNRRVPVPLRGDIYTVCGEVLASPSANKKSVYNFTNRYSPKEVFPTLCKDNRMVFFGLRSYIENELVDRVTVEDIEESELFLKQAHSMGGALPFSKDLWNKVLKETDGFLPIRIRAIPEGSTFFPGEPIIQVENVMEGAGEIAALVEAILVGTVSIATARATITRHWLERMVEWVKRDNPDVADAYLIAKWMVHDFGMRASSNSKESELLGLAHLLSFGGTDTTTSAYLAWKAGLDNGKSILALAHRIVQGYDKEQDCFDNLALQSKRFGNVAVASYVADCYNFKKAVKEKLTKVVSDVTIVPRPDSGDYIENDLLILRTAVENGWFNRNNQDMFVPTRFFPIQGDSMNPDKTEMLFQNRRNNGFSATAWGIVGVGGWLRNSCTRDTFSSAYKLSAIDDGQNGLKPVVKISETERKMSVPGPVKIIRGLPVTVFQEKELVDGFNHSIVETVFKSGYIADYSLVDVQRRNIENFNEMEKFKNIEFPYSSMTKDIQKNVLHNTR